MALVYFDASALVKLCVPEQGARLAAALWNGADLAVSSRIADAEVRAALAAGERAGHLSAEAAARARARWDRLRVGLYLVEVSPAVAERAAALIDHHALRGGDALHLASALLLDSPELVLAAWDSHLADAARGEGIRVVP